MARGGESKGGVGNDGVCIFSIVPPVLLGALRPCHLVLA